jgi:hypothetical protein
MHHGVWGSRHGAAWGGQGPRIGLARGRMGLQLAWGWHGGGIMGLAWGWHGVGIHGVGMGLAWGCWHGASMGPHGAHQSHISAWGPPLPNPPQKKKGRRPARGALTGVTGAAQRSVYAMRAVL